MWGMLTRVTDAAPRALRLRQRMDRLGISDRELARLSKVDRGALTNALVGKARSSTFGRLERVLGQLEQGAGDDGSPIMGATLDLPDGTRVHFSGMTPEEAARAARAFLDARSES